MPQEVTDVLGAGEADRESTSRTVARWRRVRKLALFALLMVTLVVVPFLLFGEPLERFARDLMTDPSSRPATAMAGLRSWLDQPNTASTTISQRATVSAPAAVVRVMVFEASAWPVPKRDAIR